MGTECIYPAKHRFDEYRVSIAEHRDVLSFSEKAQLALEALEMFRKGLPYRDRPDCLYCFYHFVPIDDDATDSQPEEAKDLVDASVSSLVDPQIAECIQLLDAEKLQEVCEVRGKLQALALQLPNVHRDSDVAENWLAIKEAAEKFLVSEPAVSVRFLESYMSAFNHYCMKSKSADARVYELAKQVIEVSTDLDAIRKASCVLHNEEHLREYMKKKAPPSDAKAIYQLEELEQAVEAEFGHERKIHGAVGKALGLLTKAGRERRRMEKDVQTEWVVRISRTGSSSFPYLKGYREYLNAIVYVGTDDVNRAIRSLDNASEVGFDSGPVLSLLFGIHDMLKHEDEATRCAQKLLDQLEYDGRDDTRRNKFDDQLILTIRAKGKEPLSASRIWESIAQRNSGKQRELVRRLEPKVLSARKENLEARVKAGMSLLDEVIAVERSDAALNARQKLRDVMVQTPLAQLAVLSLEEMDVFQQRGANGIELLFCPEISLQSATNFLHAAAGHLAEINGRNIEECIGRCPNLFASVIILKKYVAEFSVSGDLEATLKLVKHAIDMRPSGKTPALYTVIRPSQKTLHERRRLKDEIEIISSVRRLLLGKEVQEAKIDLTAAYLEYINDCKSAKKRMQLLLDAKAKELDDGRFDELRSSVERQLHKSKLILRWIAASIFAILIAIVLYIVMNR